MDSPGRTSRHYADQVKLSLAGHRYLTEQQERELLLEALDIGLSLEEARGLLAATVAKRRAAREMTHVGSTRTAPEGVKVENPAFDVTPCALIAAIITERGVAQPPFSESLQRLAASPEGIVHPSL